MRNFNLSYLKILFKLFQFTKYTLAVRGFVIAALIIASASIHSFAQDNYSLGKTNQFLKEVRQQIMSLPNQRSGLVVFTLKTSSSETFTLKVNNDQSESDQDFIIGEVENTVDGSFLIKRNVETLDGHIILKKQNRAFKFSSDAQGNAFIKEVDINLVICVNYEFIPTVSKENGRAEAVAALNDLQSLPGARGCVLLDFDGQYVSGTPWNNGNPINAAPSGMSDAAVQEAWELISEDYRPFSVNITTNESVFNSYPKTMRMRAIFTPTNTAAPGAGGVAYIGSFNWNDDTPCWIFILSGKAGGEAASHEIGHTFDLGHDGRNSPAEGYYAGQGDWAPIMGVGYYKPITQWSRGEYNSANNTQDDLASISSAKFNVGYRNDDYGNSTGEATNIASGNINRSGLIERTSDIDFLTFNSGSGTINLTINTVSRHGDLDIIARLYNSSGGLIGTYNPAGLNTSLSANVSAGKYFLSIDGTGAGNPATDGYSDYASLGSYFISGNIPNAPVSGIATVYQDCNYGGTAIGLAVGDYTLGQMNSIGIPNDWISSLKVTTGYELVGYQNDNFSGTSIIIRGNDDCLVDNAANDWISSLRVRSTGDPNLSGSYYLQNRNSGLYMDVSGPSVDDGANIIQWNYTGATNQQFKFEHLGSGTYRITPINSGKSVDVAGVSTADGANINQWTYVGGANQQFIAQALGGGYYKLIAKHSNKIVEVAGSSTAAGGNIQQWTDNNQLTGQWKLIPVSTGFTSTIQAENFSSMLGIQTETTTDAGGGLNVGWIDNSDWLAYNSINIPTSGSYRIEYRVASGGTGGTLSLDINAGATVLGTLTVPGTGGWQTWSTISHNVNINAGTYNFGIFASIGGWNINWWRITKVGAAQPIAIRGAEEMDELQVFPNPVKAKLKIKLSHEYKDGRITIFNPIGAESITTTYKHDDNDEVDVSALPTGFYTIMVTKQNRKAVKRFIKE